MTCRCWTWILNAPVLTAMQDYFADSMEHASHVIHTTPVRQQSRRPNTPRDTGAHTLRHFLPPSGRPHAASVSANLYPRRYRLPPCRYRLSPRRPPRSASGHACARARVLWRCVCVAQLLPNGLSMNRLQAASEVCGRLQSAAAGYGPDQLRTATDQLRIS